MGTEITDCCSHEIIICVHSTYQKSCDSPLHDAQCVVKRGHVEHRQASQGHMLCVYKATLVSFFRVTCCLDALKVTYVAPKFKNNATAISVYSQKM